MRTCTDGTRPPVDRARAPVCPSLGYATEHNYAPDEAEMTACKAVEAMKQKIKESNDPVQAIYQVTVASRTSYRG